MFGILLLQPYVVQKHMTVAAMLVCVVLVLRCRPPNLQGNMVAAAILFCFINPIVTPYHALWISTP